MIDVIKDDANVGHETGRQATTPLDMPARGWRQVALRAWRVSWTHNIGLVAAGTAFYGFVAIVPILIASVLIYSFLADPLAVVRSARAMELIMPRAAAQALGDQLLRVVNASSRTKGVGTLGALGIALFGARNAATALIAALNVAYGEEEKRSFRRLSLVALTITLAGFALAFAMLVAMGLIGRLHDNLAGGAAGVLVLRLVAYAVVAGLAGAGVAALYRYAPCRARPRWEWTAPGSIFVALAWAALTTGFSIYVQQFGTFSVNYGPAAAGVVLLVWLYLSGVVFLFGAQINAELERQTEQDTTEGRDKPIGSRGADAADEVAAGSGEASGR
jgi:membrane protein